MRLIEEHELDAVAGANTQQDIVDFVERVMRDLRIGMQDTAGA